MPDLFCYYVVVVDENTILKRVVSIQHERQKEFDDKSHELQHLEHLVLDIEKGDSKLFNFVTFVIKFLLTFMLD